MKDTVRKLSPKQKRFVEEYLIDLNATQAAIRAGYSPKRADSIGHENLRKPEIQKAVESKMNERSKRVEITADNVLREIARLGFSDPRKLFDENGNLKPIHELDDDIAAAVAGIDVVVRGDGENALQVRKIKFWDKNNALEKLGKHLRLWTERHEHTGKDGGPIEMILTAYLDQIDGTSRGLPSPEEEAACPID